MDQAIYKDCQSCGMPLKRDKEGGGTNKDKSKSTMYCSHCYKDGEFTWPDATALDMKQKVKSKLKEFGMPGFLACFFVRNIHKLKRWKS